MREGLSLSSLETIILLSIFESDYSESLTEVVYESELMQLLSVSIYSKVFLIVPLIIRSGDYIPAV